ncbi:hypothetical protein [Actinomadura opuntiae]|uniref:hypothetical protein n=1 Tax=Actinomadura sp. OS1-43 TaxID=604315 RepID=UPI00255B3775|nr:hypothetical protein [Actinomadura sp. OS1-43]MDL4812731.1 hypothetical protein [Actinomadura sp. OS1-43]
MTGRWVSTFAKEVLTLTGYLRPGHPTGTPYVCARGHLTTRLTARQRHALERWAAGHPDRLACRRRGCGLEVWPSPITPALEDRLRGALHQAADTVHPAPDALTRIRARARGSRRRRGRRTPR